MQYWTSMWFPIAIYDNIVRRVINDDDNTVTDLKYGDEFKRVWHDVCHSITFERDRILLNAVMDRQAGKREKCSHN